MRHTLAETKAKILDNAKRNFNRQLGKASPRAEHIATKVLISNVVLATLEESIPTALDTAFEDFKGVVKVDEKNLVRMLEAGVVEDYLVAFGFNKAIDELQSQIKNYEGV